MGAPRLAAVRLPSCRPGAPMHLPSCQGSCASSRLDHGFQNEIHSKTKNRLSNPFKLFRIQSKTVENEITRQIRIQTMYSYLGNSISGRAAGFGTGHGAHRRKKLHENRFWAQAGTITLVVIKSVVNAASLHGSGGRDPVRYRRGAAASRKTSRIKNSKSILYTGIPIGIASLDSFLQVSL